MRRCRVFWPFALLPLLLLLLAGCGECDAVGSTSFDPDFMSANGLMYLNSPFSRSLYAIDMKSGSIRWVSQVAGTVTLDSGILYIQGTYTYKALDASTGTQLWQLSGEDRKLLTSFSTAVDHLAYFIRSDGTLEAVNGRDGTIRWRQVLKEDPASTYTDNPSTIYALNGVVYVSTEYYSSVYAFRESDGALLWQYHGIHSQIRSTAFGDGMVFVSADETYALRMSDGKLLWNVTQTGGLLEANGVLYVNASASVNPLYPLNVGTSGDVFALLASDGKKIWHQTFEPPDISKHPGTYGMQLSDTQLYLFPIYPRSADLSGDTTALLFAFQASDGTLLWKAPLPARTFSLVVLRGVLYLFSGVGLSFDTGVLEAVRETDGMVLWSQSVQEAGALISGDVMYLGTAGNTDYPCASKGPAQLEKRQISTAALIWHRNLDPAPDPLQPLILTLNILGGLLVLLAVVLFFLLRRMQPVDQFPATLPGESAWTIISASLPRIERRGLLFLFLLGLVLLLTAALYGAQVRY